MQESIEKRPVAFLDRDGTLNVEIGYIKDIADLKLIDGAAEAVARLNQSGVATILVTNQTGAARGFYKEEHIRNLNTRLHELLQKQGAWLDGIYYCPHLAKAPIREYAVECTCRKPESGMVDQAFIDHPNLDHKRAFVVGDKSTDIELARNCGAKGILVLTGYGDQVVKGEYQWPVTPDFQTDSIVEAVDWIIDQLKV